MKLVSTGALLLGLTACNLPDMPGIPFDGISASGSGPLADTGEGADDDVGDGGAEGEAGSGGDGDGDGDVDCTPTNFDGVSCEAPDSIELPLLGIPAFADAVVPPPVVSPTPAEAQQQQEEIQGLIDQASVAWAFGSGQRQIVVQLSEGEYRLQTGLQLGTGVTLIGAPRSAGSEGSVITSNTLATALITGDQVLDASVLRLTLRHDAAGEDYPGGDGAIRATGVHLSRSSDVVLADLKIEGVQDGIRLGYSDPENHLPPEDGAGVIKYDEEVCQGWDRDGMLNPNYDPADPSMGPEVVGELLEEGTNIRTLILFNEIHTACATSYGIRMFRAKEARVLANHVIGALGPGCLDQTNEGIKMLCGPLYANVVAQNYVTNHVNDAMDGAMTPNAVEGPLKNRIEENMFYANQQLGLQWKSTSEPVEYLDGTEPFILNPKGYPDAPADPMDPDFFARCREGRNRFVGDNAIRRNVMLGNQRGALGIADSYAPTWCESALQCGTPPATLDPCRVLRVTGNVFDKACDLGTCEDGKGFGVAFATVRGLRFVGNWISEHRLATGDCVAPSEDEDSNGDCAFSELNAMAPGWFSDPLVTSSFPFDAGAFDLLDANFDPDQNTIETTAKDVFVAEQIASTPANRVDALAAIIRPGTYHCFDVDNDGCANGCEVLLGRDPLVVDGGSCAADCGYCAMP